VKQAVLDYLPGYMFNGFRLVSTGMALPPTQHIDKETGELKYYVRPLFEGSTPIGMYIRHQGIVDALSQ
jgi:hypothetical protein